MFLVRVMLNSHQNHHLLVPQLNDLTEDMVTTIIRRGGKSLLIRVYPLDKPQKTWDSVLVYVPDPEQTVAVSSAAVLVLTDDWEHTCPVVYACLERGQPVGLLEESPAITDNLKSSWGIVADDHPLIYRIQATKQSAQGFIDWVNKYLT